MRLRHWLVIIGGNLLVLLALLAALEGAARLFLTTDTRTLFADSEVNTRGRPLVEPHPARGFALRPGFEDGLYRIDQDGFRVGEPAPPEVPIWILLGESTTFGWRAGDGDSYPVHLQRLLAADGQPVRVINAGVPSYSSSQVLLYLDELLAGPRKPDLVLINIMWNDIWYSTVVNWYPELLVYQQPPYWLTTLVQNSALLRATLLRPLPAQDERIDIFNPLALAQYRDNLRAMLKLAASRGVKVALVEPPFAPDLMPDNGLNEFHVRYTKPFFLEVATQYRAAMAEVAAEFGVPVIDHRLSLANGGGPKQYFVDLLHPTPEGNSMLAEDVFAYFRKR